MLITSSVGSRRIRLAGVTFILIGILFTSLYLADGSHWIFKRQNVNLGENSQGREFWLDLASKAWRYFEVGVGVHPTTGLHKAGLYWPYFTDWDLGIYLQAVIDAYKLGLIPREGDWGFNYRVNRIITFLENRQLTENQLPYLWYKSEDGSPWGTTQTNIYDSSKLLISLWNLKRMRPDLGGRIDSIIKERSNYRLLVENWSGGRDLYAYYVAMAFQLWGFPEYVGVRRTLDEVKWIKTLPRVSTYGDVELPQYTVTGDPLLHCVFELPPDPSIDWLAEVTYQAHLQRYVNTGKLTAFSEGNTDLQDPSYIYEYVVASVGGGWRTWVITAPNVGEVSITPIIFLKMAAGLHALFNSDFTRFMITQLLNSLTDTSNGFMDGIDENGRIVRTVIDKTNGIILQAARYAIMGRDLSFFPYPFRYGETVNQTLVVIGWSQPRFRLDMAHTIDTLSGILIAGAVSSGSTSGILKMAIDTWVVGYNETSGSTWMIDTGSNIIATGSPGVNLISYHYNMSRAADGSPLLPVQLFRGKTALDNYLYVTSSGRIYTLQFDAEGRTIADFGVVEIIRDEYGRWVLLAFGIGIDGTRAAGELLYNIQRYPVYGRAVVFMVFDEDGNGSLEAIRVVEVIP
ncbi:DUF3131 domain-containing protein [Candidatus Bathyarchaeota archaeon]|nr:DUF3131 domain-containing protein [Candidatus Bathyarchaeota archaeon]